MRCGAVSPALFLRTFNFMADGMRASVAFGFQWARDEAVNWQTPLNGSGILANSKRLAQMRQNPEPPCTRPAGRGGRAGPAGDAAEVAGADRACRFLASLHRMAMHAGRLVQAVRQGGVLPRRIGAFP